jgi:hypothetical protein
MGDKPESGNLLTAGIGDGIIVALVKPLGELP